jgi:hypothetical protein
MDDCLFHGDAVIDLFFQHSDDALGTLGKYITVLSEEIWRR